MGGLHLLHQLVWRLLDQAKPAKRTDQSVSGSWPMRIVAATAGATLTCCFCDRSNSIIWARSVSNRTGANRIIELVKNIHDALQLNWYADFVLVMVKSVATSHAVRTDCGNISVRPHRRSVSVSSGSCARKANKIGV